MNGDNPVGTSAAACAEIDPEMWFPEKGGNATRPKAICGTCDLQAACLAYAMRFDLYGIWGGLSRDERAQERTRLGLTSQAVTYGPRNNAREDAA